MADKKISQLTAASTPLAGTEVLPVVQSGATVKVTVADLTAGREVSASKLTLLDNLVIATAGKGIDFSANPSAPGMTGELLDDYEIGAWAPTTAGDATGAFSTAYGEYTKVGRMVLVRGFLNCSSGFTANTIGGLPFAATGAGSVGGPFVTNRRSGVQETPYMFVTVFGTSNLTTHLLSSGANTPLPAGYLHSFYGCYTAS